jgi:2,4-didehydro-3-deoxy-L-rhamnonate hydrolase
MRVAAIDGRLCLGTDRGWVDVAVSSGRRFDADPQAAYDRWAEFTQWASGYSPNGEPALVRGEFGAPVPRPRQVFGADLELPAAPLIFAKYPSCISGPAEPLVVSTDSGDRVFRTAGLSSHEFLRRTHLTFRPPPPSTG